jgi:hypothetical protein
MNLVTKVLASLVGAMVAGATAHADDPPNTVGHFPILSAGLIGGFNMTPVGYTSSLGSMETADAFNGILGPDVVAEIDSHAFLLELEGFYSAFGDLRWGTRAHVILGKRSTHNVIKSIQDSAVSSSGYYTRTTEYYVHKYLPIYYGFTAGASLLSLDTTTWTSYADTSDVHSRDAAMAAVADAGLTIRSPQLELTVAPAYEVTRGNVGLHWAFGMAFPIGDHPLYFRFTGDHLFGDDPLDNSGRRTSFIMMLSLGIGSSLGLGL